MYEDSELAELYPKDYYAYQDRSGQRSAVQTLILKLLGFPVDLGPRFEPPGKVLDIGCGSGWFLASMRDEGWQAYGVEINEAAVKLGLQQAGLLITHGTLLDAGFPADFFDYVRLNHSFEHMSRPNETLREIFRILKPSGRVLFGVPNYASLNARIFGVYWRGWQVPVHAFNYSVNNFTNLLRRHGFQVATVRFTSDSGGMLLSFQLWLNRNNDKKSEDGFFYTCRPLNVLAQWMVNIFDWFGLGDAIEVVASKAAQ